MTNIESEMPQLLQESDIPSLILIVHEAFPEDCWPEKTIRLEFKEDPFGFRVIKTADEVVAYVQFQKGYYPISIITPRYDGVIGSIAVARSKRRQGWGKVLMETAIDCLAKQGCSRVILHTRESNGDMQGFCTKLGFSESGRIENFYADNERAVELTLPLAVDPYLSMGQTQGIP